VRVTHPFHPLFAQELELVKRRKNWRLDRVYYYDAAGALTTLPAEWTDLVTPDPFVIISAGRSSFHIDGLLALSELVSRLRAGQSTELSTVKPITP